MTARIRRFHVTRSARERYELRAALFGQRGDLIVADPVAIRRLARRMNELRTADASVGAPNVAAGEILALGLIHELFHAVVERYEADAAPGVLEAALAAAGGAPTELGGRTLQAFGELFAVPGTAARRPSPAVERLEELLLVRVANENPAAADLVELFDDRPLAATAPYAAALEAIERRLAAAPGFGPAGETLLDLLRAPARAAPTSLAGQLRFIRDRWGDLVGDLLDRLLMTLDVIAEEDRALHVRFGGGGTGQGGASGAAEVPAYVGLDAEVERFSADADWMPRVVMLAKSTYVWLDQLSRRHGRRIRTLDAIPDEELDTLARWGVTGLWLIGLWERSRASERIKRMRGNPDAVASAYSLDDYLIADDLGGEAAWANLRDRAWARGIRLASDMVPNHMGIDSRWVIEHPEWFLSVPEPPYPAYTFSGADLSDDPRAGIFLEDHYWDNSDAAVVFRRHERSTGEDRFIYHGNDGTSFPWNDTAQLDFLRQDVREQVIRTIVDVARRFPIIRFDAAMVLARKHVQRLWWPEPGSGGGIPSRAERAISRAEFERRMPAEFWREVVDRIAVEAPNTLLLAEAFWLLEGYFVRTLGMHRVYNSAFMHMLRDEDGAGLRKLIRDTLEFDPEILKRYVNFMSNPDEETAVEQFGKGDKYFGVATVLATLPGLPMLGHGQVEGFGEKYGMEYQRAMLDEQPDPWLLERHEREVFPLLHRRGQFAEVRDFRLYDLVRDDGSVDEGVLAYSNGRGATRSLVVYHVRYATTSGRIRDWVPFVDKQPDGSKPVRAGTLGAALGLSAADDVVVAFRDQRTGLEHVRRSAQLHADGLRLTLEAYACHVLLDIREIHDSTGIWRRLADHLGGDGVASLAGALRELELEPVHAALRGVLQPEIVGHRLVADAALGEDPPAADAEPAAQDAAFEVEPDAALEVEPELERRLADFYASVARATGAGGDVTTAARSAAARIATLAAAPREAGAGPELTPAQAARRRLERDATLVCLATLEPAGSLGPARAVGTSARAWYDDLRLEPVVADALRGLGLDESGAWRVAGRIRWLIGLARPRSTARPTPAAAVVEAWLADPAVRAALRVNRWEGAEYLDRDALSEVVEWALGMDAQATLDAARSTAAAELARLPELAEAAGYRVDRLLEDLRDGPPDGEGSEDAAATRPGRDDRPVSPP